MTFHMIFGEDPERACDKIAGIAHEFALHRTRAVRHRSRAVPSIAGNACGLRDYASIHSPPLVCSSAKCDIFVAGSRLTGKVLIVQARQAWPSPASSLECQTLR